MKPILRSYASAESLDLFDGMTLKILLRGAETDGAQAVFEDIVEPGLGPGRHIHHEQDETFIFLEGTFDVEIDGDLYRVTAGDVALVPKGSVHTWKNVGGTRGRLRYIFTPALNIEAMFREIHEIRQAGELAEAMAERIAATYPEQESVGPPL